jgi:hypothetical protein
MFGENWGNAASLGFVFALLLALWAIFHIVQSYSSPFWKAVWVVIVLFIPFFGFLAWLFLGPRSGR